MRSFQDFKYDNLLSSPVDKVTKRVQIPPCPLLFPVFDFNSLNELIFNKIRVRKN